MAVIRYNPPVPGSGADTNSLFNQWYSVLITNASFSDTGIVGSQAPVLRATLRGTDLSFTTQPVLRPVDGQINSLSFEYFDSLAIRATGLNLGGTAFGAAVLSGLSNLIEFIHKGNDSIFGTIETDNLYGYARNDTMFGGFEGDNLYGGTGADSLLGQTGEDTLNGEEGNDRLIGGTENDDLYGGAGSDRMIGGTGDDYADGDEGKDTAVGGEGEDELYGGNGNDVLSGGTDEDGLYGGEGDDNVSGGDGDDYLSGDIGDDTLTGGQGEDDLYGGDDDDQLYGGTGNDYLSGDGGNDVIRSGAGADTVYGELGADRFVFDTAIVFTNVDRIEDFEVNIDKIDLDNDIFTAAGPVGALAAGRFTLGSAAGDAGDRIIYDSATGYLYYDRDGTGGAAQNLIAELDGGLALDAGDFRVIG